jgi:hypothetical protein
MADDEKLQLEKARFEFEKERTQRSRDFEERRFRSEISAKRWAQISTLLPLLVLVIGFQLNQFGEARKRANELRIAQSNAQLQFIDQQLAQFYYPIKIRLERDNAVWEVSARNRDASTDLQLADDIEAKMLLPNHREILELIRNNFHLLTNQSEAADVTELLTQINRYQRHVTIYQALREANDLRMPYQVCEDCKYPTEFEVQIDKRIDDLQTQRRALMQQLAPAKR